MKKNVPCIAGIILLVSACGQPTGPAIPAPQGNPIKAVGSNQLFREGQAPTENREEVSKTQVASTRDDFLAYEIRVRETRNIDTITNLGVNDDVIYPGALLEGTEAAGGVLFPPQFPATLTRKPVRLSLGGISGTDQSVSFTVDNPVLSATRDAINAKLSSLVGASAAARMEFEKEEVYSSDQFSLSLGVGMKWPKDQHIDAQLDLTTAEEKTRIVVRFKQVYYSVDMDTPAGVSDLLAGDGTEISNFIGNTNLMYVSRVYYGRQAFFIIESSCSSSELKAAIDGAFKTDPKDPEGGKTVDVNFALSYKTVLNNSSIKAVVYGGDAKLSAKIIENGYDGLVAFINEGASFDAATGSNAMPLHYQMRFVADNKVGVISTNADYTMKQYVRVKQKVKVTLKEIKCNGSDDGYQAWPPGKDNTSEFFGDVKIRAVSSPGTETDGDWITLMKIDSPISLQDGQVSDKTAYETLTFNPVVPEKSYIDIVGHFTEDDAVDDDLGTVSHKQHLYDGWNGSKKLVFENENEGLDILLEFMALP